MERIGLEPGAEIGGYTVVAPLGSGGMGTVYRAVDGGGTTVALKLLHPHVGADPVARDRLRREVQALQRLRHPAVAAVLDAEADSTEAFLVTELVPGDSLDVHVRRRGPLGPEALLELARGLLGALDAVHGAGVVHRDLKPANVMITPDGPVLIDFGIAQASGDTQVTSTGFVVGTPGYLAPELLDGADPTPASDLWGWAAVLVFAATGRPPFGTGPLEGVLARAHSGAPDLAGLGARTAAALRGALAPDLDRRTPAADVVAALAVVVDEGDVPANEADGEATTVLGSQTAATALLAPEAAATPPVPATVALPAPGAGAAPAQDGGTRVLDAATLDGARRTPPPEVDDDDADDSDEDDEDGVEWLQDDLDHSGAEEPEGSGYVRPPTIRRWGTLLALGLLVAAAGSLYPGWTLLVTLVLVLLVRASGSTVEALHGRRERRGVRRADRAGAVLTTPGTCCGPSSGWSPRSSSARACWSSCWASHGGRSARVP
ncbi:serine/threonine-protein kinase [Cellulomonas soli]